MEWEITYIRESVRLEIDPWPVGLRAVYVRIKTPPNDLQIARSRLNEVRHENP
ncbi:MAG: hypothetical protein HQL91_03085 [Magnetococcales bacterium]|nr:hypothetical protein [Magnetococcales bacterium]